MQNPIDYIANIVDTLADGINSYFPTYRLAGTDESIRPYEDSPLVSIAMHMARGNKGKSHHGHKHQASKTITVHTGSGERHIERDAHLGSGKGLAQYIAETCKISLNAARKAIKASSRKK